jgi:streptogramin lyase
MGSIHNQDNGKEEGTMRKTFLVALALSLASASATWAAGTVSGKVTSEDGNAMHGVMVSAFDMENQVSFTVNSVDDGSFKIEGLDPGTYRVRARLLGKEDSWSDEIQIKDGAAIDGLSFAMQPHSDPNMQRRGVDLFGFLKFDSEDDKRNFKMSCAYCHQIGTIGFRSPEEPVDWETMITRMDGFGGLYKHTQETIVERLLDAYTQEAMASWPQWEAPPAPEGRALDVTITEWDIGRQDMAMIHDLEIGKDGKIYTVDMINDAIVTLDPATNARETIAFPGGKDPETDATPRKGPHSIEVDENGDMWMTLALSGQMAKYEVATGEFTIVSSAPDPAPRGMYPHTLRLDQKGIVWYTDAGGAVFSLDPETLERKRYVLPMKDQRSAGGRGESAGVTPYGIDVAPDGRIWYSKLNGNRIGVIDPAFDDGNIKEYEPPFIGPRRLQLGDDGIVWVPSFGNGILGKFDPDTEEWTLYDLPDAEDEIPYALSVHPKTGDVWICGTGSDSMYRFIPATEELIMYRMPSHVTYTREVEFHEDGSVWVCNSNYPVRHTERGRGSVIRIETGD